MKKFLFLTLCASLFFACKSDDERTCRSCSSDQTAAFEICREPNGNASVNGEDTGTDYDTYLDDLIEAGAGCGG